MVSSPCPTGKICNMTEGAAEMQLRWMLDNNKVRVTAKDRKKLGVYRCWKCNFWHVGRSDKRGRAG